MLNYQIKVTLLRATPEAATELVDALQNEFDLEVGEFLVEAFVQKDDGSWEGISLNDND